jgi:redox-sensitive bicupin YhaK (pirin superfamily)
VSVELCPRSQSCTSYASFAMRAPLPSRRQIVLAAGGLAAPVALGLALAGRRKPAPAATGSRDVRAIVDAQSTADGAGVKLRRAVGSQVLPLLDPFLLLDEMHSDNPEDYARGFPTHPHRGFETVTYVLEGAVDHRDSLGNHGHLTAGSLQWMTAGRGIVHAEFPTHDASSTRLWGFQLWVNLPAAKKMGTPRYQDIAPPRVPEVGVDDAVVRVLAGSSGGVRGPVDAVATAPTMLDVRLAAATNYEQAITPTDNAFLYVIDGALEVGPSRTPVGRGQAAVLGAGDSVVLRGRPAGRALLFAARPIGEPVARSGPFVMNTEEELRRAWDDYRNGVLVSPG